MIKYKIDVTKELAKKGYTTTKIRKEKLLPESVLTKLRQGDPTISVKTLGAICGMLRMQPGDVIESELTDKEKVRFFL